MNKLEKSAAEAAGVRFEELSFGNDGRVLAIAGELDLMTVEALRAALTAATGAGIRRLVVDLTEVSFIDSVSIGAMVSARRRLGVEGRLAIVVEPGSFAKLVFEAAGLASVLRLCDSREQALAQVRG